MKISKLFHWLYALVMLLPIFAIGVTCAYVIFNKNAYQSYAGETLNESDYENIEVSDMEIGKSYYLILPTNYTFQQTTSNTSFTVSDVYLNGNLKNVTELRFYVITNNTTLTIQAIGTDAFIVQSSSVNTIQFKFNGVNNNNYVSQINEVLYEKTYVLSTYLSEVFYYSIDEVEQSPLFSWSYDSFLATPITYISDLFGIASNSPVILLMSYWLAISIIWLVFDLVMYMPLLVHRWLDKGVLE